MRRLSAHLAGRVRPLAEDEDVTAALERALSEVRGRPVRLRAAPFPPMTASGFWLDRAGHDLIVFEENTDPGHQLVIIGHEAWHMFNDHCGHVTAYGSAASRADAADALGALTDVVAELSEALDVPVDEPLDGRTDATLHFAARTDSRSLDAEVEAELFGFRFATDVQAVLDDAAHRVTARGVAGRIQVTMTHRLRET
jgi:hypothetical protein